MTQTNTKYAWTARIAHGAREEYIRRHDQIWPEMREVLAEAGIENYSIWLSGTRLFGYYECALGIDHAAAVQAASPVVDRWNAYMKDILTMELDPITGAQPLLEQVWDFDPSD